MSTTTQWLTPAEQEAWRAYLRGFRAVEDALDRDLQAHGVSLSEYEILSMLSEQPLSRMRMSALAELCVQSRSRMTHTATRLERRGWVTRERYRDDRRGIELVLTAAGRRKIDNLAPVHVESVRTNLIDVLTPAEFAALGKAMGLLHTHLLPEPSAGLAESEPAASA